MPMPNPNVFMHHRVRYEAREGLFRKETLASLRLGG